MKAWITKYALTRGILEVNGEVSRTAATMFVYTDGRARCVAHGEGRDWHRTENSAKHRAEVMRQSKLDSLRQQINKLIGMEF